MVALPTAFTQYTRSLLGDERYGRFIDAFSEEPPVSIRINPRTALATQGDDGAVPWCSLGRYLGRRPDFTFDPLLHAGCYYVQEAASMFLHHALQQHVDRPVQVLDLCAAPGGKATCALGALPPGTALWANDPVPRRASILSENIQKWGHPQCTVTCARPADYVRAGLTFDVVICDVPCSGEGMFRRDPQAVAAWSTHVIDACARQQRDIVAQAWQCLRPGGLLVYSTCTLNTRENEENVLHIIATHGARPLAVDTSPQWAITPSLLPALSAPVYRFIPGITRSEGLFVALLRKPEAPAQRTRTATAAPNVIYDSRQPRQQPVATAQLTYDEAIAYLRGMPLTLPAGTPRGLVAVAFRGQTLGLVKNIGTRANNLYPKEWRIKSSHTPEEYKPVIAI